MGMIALIIFFITLLVSLIHIGWGFGLVWPAKDQQSLVKAVIGEPNMHLMPSKKLLLIIAFAFFISGVFALWGGYIIAPPLPLWIRELILFLSAFAFGTRGLAPFLIAKQLGERTQPFKTLDRVLYAPLSLIISIGFIILLINT